MKRVLTHTITASIMFGLGYGLVIACSKKDDGGRKKHKQVTDTEETTSGALAIDVNPLAGAYPQGLAVGAFSTSTATGEFRPGSLAVGANLALLGESIEDKDPADLSYGEQYELEQRRLRGITDTCLNSGMLSGLVNMRGMGNGCYAPGLAAYQWDDPTGDHSNPGNPSNPNQSHLGITNPDGEACMPAYGRALLQGTTADMQQAMHLIQGIMCQLKKDGGDTSLPEAGQTRDYVSLVQSQLGATTTVTIPTGPSSTKSYVMTITEASLTGLTDAVVGGSGSARARYRFSLVVDAVWRDGANNPFTDKIHVNMVHSPANADNSNYDGVFWYTNLYGGSAPAPLTGKSLAYSRSGTIDNPRIVYEMRWATFGNSLVSGTHFESNGRLDLNGGGSFSLPTSDGDYGLYTGLANIWYAIFDINPNTSLGSIALWNNPGGQYYRENARGYLATMTAEGDDVVGCAALGAVFESDNNTGVSVRRFIREGDIALSPVKFETSTNQVRKQCFKRVVGESRANWNIDTTKTTSAIGYDLVSKTAHGITGPTLTSLKSLGTDVTTGAASLP